MYIMVLLSLAAAERTSIRLFIKREGNRFCRSHLKVSNNNKQSSKQQNGT
jgi:hypothetical protein